MAVETIWQQEGEGKRAAVQKMFGEIAPTYDRVNGLISLSLHGRWRAFAASTLDLAEGDRALDVCCGTGDFIPHLRRAVGESGSVVGVDFCSPMLDMASQKGVDGQLSLGDACQLPFGSNRFDGVSVGWGIRNVPDIDLAHREAFRVLKPGGRFVSLDMARPTSAILRRFSEFTFHNVVPFLGSLFGKREAYTYLPKSTERFMSREELAASMDRAGFKDIRYRSLMMGNICVHWGAKP